MKIDDQNLRIGEVAQAIRLAVHTGELKIRGRSTDGQRLRPGGSAAARPPENVKIRIASDAFISIPSWPFLRRLKHIEGLPLSVLPVPAYASPLRPAAAVRENERTRVTQSMRGSTMKCSTVNRREMAPAKLPLAELVS